MTRRTAPGQSEDLHTQLHIPAAHNAGISKFGRTQPSIDYLTNWARCCATAGSCIYQILTSSTPYYEFSRHDMDVWQTLTTTLLLANGIVGFDASGFDPSLASRQYTKRVEFMIQQLRVKVLFNTKINAILNLYVTTTQKHDSQIASSLTKRNS